MTYGYNSVVWVPRSKRDEEWCKQVSDQLILNSEQRSDAVKRVYACRKMYRDGQYTDSYDYLYQSVTKKVTDECGVEKTVTMVPPAKVRHIPIIAPMVRRLVSEEKDRPDVFAAYTTDAINSQKKEDAYIADLTMRQELAMQEKLDVYRMQVLLVDARKQMLDQGIDQEPDGQLLLQQVGMELGRLRQVMQRSIQFNEREMAKIRHFWRYEHKDVQELFAENVVDFLKTHKRLAHIFNRNFEEFLTTGKEIYFCDWEPGMEDPMIEQVFFEDVSVPYNEYVNFLSEHSWCVLRQYMSLDNLVSTMGNFIDRDKMEMLRSGSGMWDQRRDNFLTMPDGTVLPGFIMERQKANNQTSADLYTVYKTYFKLDTEINVLVGPNKHRQEAPPFIKVLDDDEVEHYRRNPNRLRGAKVVKRYKQELYRSVRIGPDVWLNAGLHPVQLRSENHKGRIGLPLIGHAEHYYYSNASMIWDTKDVQELFNILFYQKELLVVLAGVRGIIVDLSQMQEGMELPELIYYMRQGIIPIETLGEDGSPKNTSFNQFSTYDQTISPGIQLIDGTLTMLRQLASEITGINDVRMGVVKPTDQVGTSQMAFQNSSMATEHYFQEHEVLKEEVLTRAVNLAQYAYREGKKASFVAGDKTLSRLRIPPGGMNGEFKVVMKNGRKEASMLQEIQNLTRNQYQRGAVRASQLIETLNVDSMTQMRKLVQDYEELAIEQNEAKLNADAERMGQVEQRKAQMDAQVQQQMIEHKERLAQLANGIEQAKLEIAAQKAAGEAQIAMQVADKQAEAKRYQVDTEAQVEREYLEFQKLELAVNNQNQQTSMLLEAVHQKLQAKSKERVKD